MTGLLLSLLLQAAPAPSAPPPATLTVEGWVLAQRTWATSSDPRDLPGIRLQVEFRASRLRLAARGDATGIVGQFVQDKPETFKAAEGYLAAAYDALSIPNLATIGPALAAGTAISLETKAGAQPTTPKSFTFGLGARASWEGGWAYLLVGQHQSLRGVAAILTWQTKVSDRVANIGTLGAGARGHYFATTGVAVRFK